MKMSSRRKKPEWDASISDLNSYKLTPQEMLAKKQSLVSENKPLVKRMHLIQKINKAKKEGNTKGVLRETIINNQNKNEISSDFNVSGNSKESNNPNFYELCSIVMFLNQKVKQLEEELEEERQARYMLEDQVEFLTKKCLASKNHLEMSKTCSVTSNKCPANSTFLSNTSILVNPTPSHQTFPISNSISDNFSNETINTTLPTKNKIADDMLGKSPKEESDNISGILSNEMSSKSNKIADKMSDVASLSLDSSPSFNVEEIEGRLQAMSNRQAQTLQQLNKLKLMKFN